MLPSVSAVIVAAGSGRRFGSKKPKQLLPLAGRPVLTHTISAFEASPVISEIVLVLPEIYLDTCLAEAVHPFSFTKVKAVCGGASRTESSRRGFEASTGDVVLVHDGVRPFVDERLIEAVARAAVYNQAAMAAVPLRDTLKLVDEDGLVAGGLPRDNLWRAQTPQGFQRRVLEAAFEAAGNDMSNDDIALLEKLGLRAVIVESSERNF